MDELVLVDRIYEAAVLPEFWPAVLRDFAGVAEGLHALVIATNGKDLRWRGSSALAEAMTGEVYAYQGGQERTRRLLAANRRGFVSDRDVFSEEEMCNEPLFRDYLRPRGLGRGIATVIQAPTDDLIIIHAEGDNRLGPLSGLVTERLNGLRPHLARSAMLSARLAFERARTAVETLAALGFPACAVTDASKLIVANSTFDAERSLWTTGGFDRLALRDAQAGRLLGDALAGLRESGGVRSIALRASEAGKPGVLHVVPVRRSAHDLFGRAEAILVVTRSASRATGAAPLLQALFDLTPAEADLAVRIGAGETTEAIAAADNKSAHTVRNQLKSLLHKTGCRRQVDLAKLLAQLLPSSG